MYIWVGCALPQEFETALRARCLELNHNIGLDTSGFSLPQHISLKISFHADEQQTDGILDFLTALLQGKEKFYVNLSGIENTGSILWLRFAENAHLQVLHQILDTQLLQHFGIPLHTFDKAFLFHSTLFMGDPEGLARMHRLLAEFPLPRSLPVDTILLGTSPTGEGGSYRVVRQISLS